MKHDLKISRLAMVCVLCASAACPALGASSVRSLGGNGTYSSASSAATAKTASAGNGAGGLTTARAGSMRVASSSQNAVNAGAGNSAAVRAAGTPRLSIGKYLGSGTSLSGGSSIKNQAAGAASSSSSNGGSMTPEVAADLNDLHNRVDATDKTVNDMYTNDELNRKFDEKQDKLHSKDEYIVVEEGGDIYLDVKNLTDALQDKLGGQGGSAGQVEITTDANGIKWRQGNGEWQTLAAWDQLKGADGKDGKDGEGLDPVVLNTTVEKAVKAQIPTKVSEFENDAEYVTQAQLEKAQLDGKVDLSGYATVDALKGKADKTEVTALHTEIGNVSTVASGAATVANTAKTAADSATSAATAAQTAADTAATTANTAKTAADSAATIAGAAKTAADAASAKADSVEASLANKANKADIPTKVGDLTNDKGYLTEHQSLDGYATTSYVQNNYVTQEQLDAAQLGGEVDLTAYAKTADVTTALDKKADKDSVPTKVSQLTNDKGYLTEHQSLDDYAKKTDINSTLNNYVTTEVLETKADKTAVPTKVSQLENDEGYLKEHQSLDDYAKKTDINSTLNNYVTTEVLETKADKTAVPTKVSQLENDEGYLKEHQSLDGYATTSYVQNNYVTQEQLDAAQLGGEVDLTAYAKTADVNTALGNKADKDSVPTKVSQLENDEGYLKQHQSLDDYAKTADINSTLENYVTTEVLETKADKTAVPTKVSQLENDEGYLKQHQSLDGYVNTNGVDNTKNKVLAIYNGEQTWLEIAE